MTKQTINYGGAKIAFVVDSYNCLLRSLTDGDIRRGVLAGQLLDESFILNLHQVFDAFSFSGSFYLFYLRLTDLLVLYKSKFLFFFSFPFVSKLLVLLSFYNR